MEDVSSRYSQFSSKYIGGSLIVPQGVMFGLGMDMLVVPATIAKGYRLRYLFRSCTIGIASSMLIIPVKLLRAYVGDFIHTRGQRNKHLAHTDIPSSLYR